MWPDLIFITGHNYVFYIVMAGLMDFIRLAIENLVIAMKPLIGRKEEKKILERPFESNEAELVAVLGWWRVGKIVSTHHLVKGSH